MLDDRSKNLSIVRQVSLKAAVEIYRGTDPKTLQVEDLTELADKIFTYLRQDVDNAKEVSKGGYNKYPGKPNNFPKTKTTRDPNEPASEPQKNLLKVLVDKEGINEATKKKVLLNINTITKSQANETIKKLKEVTD